MWVLCDRLLEELVRLLTTPLSQRYEALVQQAFAASGGGQGGGERPLSLAKQFRRPTQVSQLEVTRNH